MIKFFVIIFLCLFGLVSTPESRAQCAGYIQNMTVSDGTNGGWRFFVCNNFNQYYDGMRVSFNSNPDATFSSSNWVIFPYTHGTGYLTPVWKGAFFVTVYTYDISIDYYCSFLTIFRYY